MSFSPARALSLFSLHFLSRSRKTASKANSSYFTESGSYYYFSHLFPINIFVSCPPWINHKNISLDPWPFRLTLISHPLYANLLEKTAFTCWFCYTSALCMSPLKQAILFTITTSFLWAFLLPHTLFNFFPHSASHLLRFLIVYFFIMLIVSYPP